MTSEHEMRNTTKDTALRLALEALDEMLAAERATNRPPETVMQAEAKLDRIRKAAAQCLEAITACREAHAQPAGERGELPKDVLHALARRCLWIAYCWNDHNFEEAYKYARRDAEACGIKSFEDANHWIEGGYGEAATLLSSDAQPSEWVGLSDEEIQDVWCSAKNEAGQYGPFWFARAIAAKLKEKNHVK